MRDLHIGISEELRALVPRPLIDGMTMILVSDTSFVWSKRGDKVVDVSNEWVTEVARKELDLDESIDELLEQGREGEIRLSQDITDSPGDNEPLLLRE